jgi:hypothetical protein
VVWVRAGIHTYVVVTIVLVGRGVAYEVYCLVVTYYVLCFDHLVVAGCESVAWSVHTLCSHGALHAVGVVSYVPSVKELTGDEGPRSALVCGPYHGCGD